MICGDSLPVSRTLIRPHWFTHRDNGNYVPVIPVDELPLGVCLEGVPRSINPDEAQGMKFLGSLRYTGQTYSLVEQKTAQPPAAKSICAPKSAEIKRSGSPMGLYSKRLDNLETVAVKEKPLSLADAIAKASPDVAARFNYKLQPPLPPSGKQPDQSKKEYCTYWIKYGACDFTQQGCMYKHEMPDMKTLREKVGINYIPKWWAEKHPGISPQQSSWMRERLRVHDAAAAKVQSGKLKVLDDNDADASSGGEQKSKPTTVQRVAAVTGRHHPSSSFKAPDADHNLKATPAEPRRRSHEPFSDTELNYVYTPLADGQKINKALERALRTSFPASRHSPVAVREANISSSTTNSPHRRASSSGLRDHAGRSPPKGNVHNFFEYIRTHGAPPPPNSSPVLAPERRVAQDTSRVRQVPGHVKKGPFDPRPSPAVTGSTTTDASQPTNHLNVRSVKPKSLTIVSKTARAGCPSPQNVTHGLLSSRHAPNATSSETPRSHAPQQCLIDLDDHFDLNSLVSATPAAARSAMTTAAQRAGNDEAESEDLMPLSERDSSSTVDSGSSSNSSSGHRGRRTRSSSLDWDSDVPSFEPTRVVEPTKRVMADGTKRGLAAPRGKVERRTMRQKAAPTTAAAAVGSGSVSSTGTAVVASANIKRRHSGGTRGSVRPPRAKKVIATIAEPQTVAVGAGPLPNNEKPKREGRVVPTKIRRPKVINHVGGSHVLKGLQQQQQVRTEVKQLREV
ncbi:uncharacterized protein J3D65DRAFT_674479 [Phyllosticta citribraziliensis]|uniref:C3H1-type domain-containing protein n=1 Tax=Phyllosticta citribraziliensis TaxID=989973 RepID=A0ABR1M4Z0_9PEZI